MIQVIKRGVQGAAMALFALYLCWPEDPLPGEVIFRADAVANGLAALSARVLFTSVAISAILLALTYLFGRLFCGWVCPLGTTVDLMDAALGVRVRARASRLLKYHLLAALVAVAAAGISLVWILDPMAWASRLISVLSFSAAPDWPAVAILLVALLATELGLGRRGFCRALCPLGALLGAVASVSPFKREVLAACSQCGTCTRVCRTGAIGATAEEFDRAECIHCHDCAEGCPEGALRFGYLASPLPTRPDTLRRQYLLTLGGGAAAGLLLRGTGAQAGPARAVHPPGAVDPERFGDLCLRCGACVRVCPKGSLRPAVDELGPLGFQLPILSGRDGGCAFDCVACGEACPSGAIEALSLADKQKTRIGVAAFDRSRCIAYADKTPCVVCFTACPTDAIFFLKTENPLEWGGHLYVPWVDKEKCIGCGLCEAICPLGDRSGVRIAPLESHPEGTRGL